MDQKIFRGSFQKISKLYANHLHPKVDRNFLEEIFAISRGFRHANAVSMKISWGHFMIFTYVKSALDRDDLG